MKVHFLFPSPKKPWVALVKNGKAPDHPLYGLTYFPGLGLDVSFSDKGFTDSIASFLFSLVDRWFRSRTYMGFKPLVVLAQLVEMRRAQVIVSFAENVGLPALLCKKLRFISAPVVFVSIGFDHRFLRRASFMRRFVGILLKEARRIVVYSKKEKEVYHKVFGISPEKLRVVSLGVDMEFLRPEESEEPIDILAAGRDYGRDFGTLLEAIRGTQYTVVLVCPKEHLPNTPLPENVTHYEHVSYRKMRTLYSKTKIVAVTVHPYKTSGQFGILEAWAMGKAVIASDVSRIVTAFSAVDGEHYRLVTPGSVTKLREVIDELLGSASLWRRYGRQGRSLVVHNHTSKSYAQAVASVVKEVVDGQG